MKLFKYSALSLAVMGLAACGGGGSSDDDGSTATEGTAAYVAENKSLKGDFSEDVTLVATNDYSIDGAVNFLDGATLTIPAGTKLFGLTGSSYLAINRGAKIMADGTAAEPIIFTSAQDIAGTATQNDQGQWGGLTLLGKASANKGERTYEAGTQLYGPDGTAVQADCPGVDFAANPENCGDDDDNSGVLDYVIVKYSGFEIEVDKELNGLSLAGVGSGTSISNVAVIGSADDGIELWGGTVDLTNVYVYNAGDDSLDTDQGYRGTIENVYVQQVVVDAEVDSRAIEADGRDDTTVGGGDPASLVTLKNATLDTIGRAVRLREGTGYVFDNVQINVKTSSADPASVDYFQDIAAIRISDTVTFNASNISVAAGGLGIKNDAVVIANNEVNNAGLVADGKGMYRDADTLNYFRSLGVVPKEIVGISEDMCDESGGSCTGVGSEGTFAGEVATDNTVTGVDQSLFTWVADAVSDKPVVFITGDITTSRTLTKDTDWALNGEVNVIAPAVLTVEAGTRVFGVTGSSYLAINRGAQIDAQGTAAEPIIFTSALDVAGANSGDEQGQWGGLTLLGDASANKGERTYEAGSQLYGPDGTAAAVDCTTVVDAVTNSANCGDDDDNSGTLNYVVIKYSGYEVEKDKELNGLSLAGVGSGTTISNIAIIGSADDGIEFWGGSVDVDGLYVYNAGDDSIDTDQGFTGTLTNVVAVQNVVDDEVDSRVIEADGNSTTIAGDPASLVTMENAILKAKGRAIRLREGTGYVFNNVQVLVESSTDTSVAAVRISDDHTVTENNINGAGAGLAIKNLANTSALYHDVLTSDYFGGVTTTFTEVWSGTLLEDDDTTLSINTPANQYDFSWAQ